LTASNLFFCKSSYLFPEDIRQCDYKRTLRDLREVYANLLMVSYQSLTYNICL